MTTRARYLDDGIAYTERLDLDAWRLYMPGVARTRAACKRGDWLGARATMPRPFVTNPRDLTRHALAGARGAGPAARAAWRSRCGIADRRGAQISRAAHARFQRTAPVMDALAEIAHLDGDLRPGRSARGRGLCRPRRSAIRGSAVRSQSGSGARQALSALPEGCAEPYRFEAAGQWREAAAAWDRLGCPYEHACMLAWYGDETAQREALEKFESLGAAPAPQQLRAGSMRAGGARRVPRGRAPRLARIRSA